MSRGFEPATRQQYPTPQPTALPRTHSCYTGNNDNNIIISRSAQRCRRGVCALPFASPPSTSAQRTNQPPAIMRINRNVMERKGSTEWNETKRTCAVDTCGTLRLSTCAQVNGIIESAFAQNSKTYARTTLFYRTEHAHTCLAHICIGVAKNGKRKRNRWAKKIIIATPGTATPNESIRCGIIRSKQS